MDSSSAQGSQAGYQPGQHVPQLDGLRGLAILMVTLYRFGRTIPESSSGSALHQFLELGSRGVELFFVLSGFLITGILLDTRGQTYQLRNFFARRSLRIFPLYFGALILCVWCIPAMATATGATSVEQAFAPAREQQFYLWCYLTNLQMSLSDAWCFGPLDHFWSLAVEEHFYLLWPIAIVFCRSRSLLGCALALMCASVLTRTAWLAAGGTATAAEVLTIWRCDGLLLGAIVAILARSSVVAWRQVARTARWAWLPLLLVAIGIDATDKRLWMINTTVWCAVWFCLMVNLLVSLRSGVLSWLFCQNWLRSLGKLSYGMYVFQAPLIPLVAALGWSAGVSLSIDLLYVGFMFALTVGVAWCSWHGFEKHWLRLKDYFSQSDIDPAKTSHQDCPKPSWGQVRPAP